MLASLLCTSDKILRIYINPLLKSKMKDPCPSDNYCAIPISTAMSKLLETLILTHIQEFISVRDNQLSFQRNHSNDMCILVLEDVINYYNRLSTPIFVFF